MRKIIKDINHLLNITIILILLITIYIENLDYETIEVLNNKNLAVVTSGSKTEKTLALSFDDGPHPEYTVQILDILK